MENWLVAIGLIDSLDVHFCFDQYNKVASYLSKWNLVILLVQKHIGFLALTSDIPSDVEPDDVAPETASSGTVRLPVTAAEKLESLPQEPAVPTSAPAMVEGEEGGFGSESSLLAGVPLSAPGGQTDPQI